MTALELAREVTRTHQAHAYRLRGPLCYDAKPWGVGSHHGWRLLDGWTASAIVAVADRLNPKNLAKFESYALETQAFVAFGVLKKVNERVPA